MSTVHSPPVDGQTSHPVGFNEQSYYDPFFPSSPSDEHLVPIASEHTPSQYSYHSPSPPHHERSDKLNGTSTLHEYQQPAPQIALAQHFDPANTPSSHTEFDQGNSSYDFLSPNPYPSDNGYNASSEHTATPEYGDGLYLDENFGLLNNPDHGSVLTGVGTREIDELASTGPHVDSPLISNRTTRASLGTATLASHLMSPVLTDTNGTTSRQATASPTPGTAFVKSEPSQIPAPVFSASSIYQANMLQQQHFGQMQQTPTATETSKGSSPDLAPTIPSIARAPSPSPIVRVEKYTRGDSPAPHPGQFVLGSTKRPRGGSRSSHLAVQDGGSDSQDEDDHVRDGQHDVRKGLDPDARYRVSDVEQPNFKEQDETSHLASKKLEVEEWLDRSAPGNEDNPEAPPQKPVLSKRQRARSTGNMTLSRQNLESLRYAPPDAHIPGPGLLIDEESGQDDSETDDDGTASIENSPPPTTAREEEPMNENPGEARPGVYDELPNQPRLYRAKLWQDPLYDSSDPGVKMQPVTSNEAIMRFDQRAGDMETLSRVATWGTRRLSDSDLHSLFHRFSISEASNPRAGDKGKRDRSGSFFQQAAAKLIPRRSGTVKGSLKRHESESSKNDPPITRPTNLDHARKDSAGSGNLSIPQLPQTGLKRMSSLTKRPKSPRINTTSAMVAMASQIGALGGTATATSSPTGPWTTTKNVIKRSRSRSELNGASGSGGLGLYTPASSSETEVGLTQLLMKQGGPPMPTLAAPKTEDQPTQSGLGEDDDEDDEAEEDPGVKMDLSIRSDTITPTLDGFKKNIRDLNPRLPPYMFDRVAQEQLRRYKKLVDFKIKHAQVLATGKCPSGKHCTELGGMPTYLPSKASAREPDLSHTGFAVSGLGPSDDEANALADGIVTAAQFPPGVPMPPVKRLPAEFECSLCFKVKKFQKPSDWSKHVHEDVQPFTCTFANCAEPKSFKRKADWVRHENERHRQLEWWVCNMHDCTHKCYRKDNFVQHLVREHKLPEPKVKTLKVGKPAVRGPSSQKARTARLSDDNGDESHDEVDQVWKLVEQCRHETQKDPKNEPCKFCGNKCPTWKKLTVHLAKHMEQISMPVLQVVKQKDVTPETILSPIERIVSQQTSMSPTIQSPFSHDNSVPPYGHTNSTLTQIPGAFAPLQTGGGYFNGVPNMQPQVAYQRVSSNTYPPAQPQAQPLVANYDGNRPADQYVMPGFTTQAPYSGSPAPAFNGVNPALHGYRAAASASPDHMYNSNDLQGAIPQPRSSPFEDANAFQYMSTPSQQQTSQQQQQTQYVTSPIESSMYPLGPGPGETASSYPPISGHHQQHHHQQQQHQGHQQMNPSGPMGGDMTHATVGVGGRGFSAGMGMAYPGEPAPQPTQAQQPPPSHYHQNPQHNMNGGGMCPHMGGNLGGYGYQSN